MTRTELHALAERLETYANDTEAQYAAADFLRQIAQAQSAGWACTGKNDGSQVFSESCLSSNPEYVRLYHDYNWRKVYTLPLED